MEKDLISVIVPIYNVEKYLRQCIDSIINQTYKNLEIILVDDGSTDNSSKICKEYKNKDSRIKLFHKKNGGVSSARNYGIEKMSGEYVLFLDGDDTINVDAVEKLIEFIGTNELVIGNVRSSDIKKRLGSESKELTNEEIEAFINAIFHVQSNYNDCLRYCGGKFFKSDLISRNSLRYDLNLKIGEDTVFNIQAARLAKGVCYYSEMFYNYNERTDSVSRKYSQQYIDNYNSFFEYVDDNDLLYKNYLLYSLIIMQLAYLCRDFFFNKECFIEYKDGKKLLDATLHKRMFLKAVKNVKLSLVSKKESILVLLLRLKMYKLVQLYCLLIKRIYG